MTIRSRPGRAISTAGEPRFTAGPEFRICSTGEPSRSRLFSSSKRNTSLNGRPGTSSRAQPVKFSAALFIRTILPAMSVVITPSPMERNVTASRSFSAASASSTCWRSWIRARSSSLDCLSNCSDWRNSPVNSSAADRARTWTQTTPKSNREIVRPPNKAIRGR